MLYREARDGEPRLKRIAVRRKNSSRNRLSTPDGGSPILHTPPPGETADIAPNAEQRSSCQSGYKVNLAFHECRPHSSSFGRASLRLPPRLRAWMEQLLDADSLGVPLPRPKSPCNSSGKLLTSASSNPSADSLDQADISSPSAVANLRSACIECRDSGGLLSAIGDWNRYLTQNRTTGQRKNLEQGWNVSPSYLQVAGELPGRAVTRQPSCAFQCPPIGTAGWRSPRQADPEKRGSYCARAAPASNQRCQFAV